MNGWMKSIIIVFVDPGALCALKKRKKTRIVLACFFSFSVGVSVNMKPICSSFLLAPEQHHDARVFTPQTFSGNALNNN